MEAKKAEAARLAKEQERKRLAALAAAPVPTFKVLVSGDAMGRLEKLYSTVEAQVAKVGSFDALLCVGASFLPQDAAGESPEGLVDYLTGTKRPPVETFFIDSSPVLLQAYPQGEVLSPQLHFLGGYGIKEVKGLRIAYLSGRYDASVYDRDDAEFVGGAFTSRAVKELQRQASQDRRQRGIDVLLTSSWPAEIEENIQDGSLPSDVPDGKSWREATSAPIAELCRALEPRYHLFGSADLFYQRLPFQAPRRGHSCRCIGFGTVGSSSKQRKWLHALSLSPMARMKVDELRQLPAAFTPCPFTAPKKRSAEEEAAAEASAAKRRKLGPEEMDKELPNKAVDLLKAGSFSEYFSLATKLESRLLVLHTANDSDDEGGKDNAKKEAAKAEPVKALPVIEPEPEEGLTEEERERRKEAAAWLAAAPQDDVVRFTFDQEGALGLKLSGDAPPQILEVKDGSLSAKKAPRVPVGGVVLAVNGYILSEKDNAQVIKALAKRPVVLDILWPEDKMKPSVNRA